MRNIVFLITLFLMNALVRGQHPKLRFVDYDLVFDSLKNGNNQTSTLNHNSQYYWDFYNLLLLDSSNISLVEKICPYIVDEIRGSEIPILPNCFSVGFHISSDRVEDVFAEENIGRIFSCLSENDVGARIGSSLYVKDNKVVFSVVVRNGSYLVRGKLESGVFQMNIVSSITE